MKGREGEKRGENTGEVWGDVTSPNLKNSRFRRAIEDFAGHQEELYCPVEKGRLGIAPQRRS